MPHTKNTFLHLMYVPWTGLGLYGGFRGNRWLRNRITIFKNFVVPSLRNQNNKNFILWCSWRPQERGNKYVQELKKYMDGIKEFQTVFTYNGICFWDDKLDDETARKNLVINLHYSTRDLLPFIKDNQDILMTIQPSDDLYSSSVVGDIQGFFEQNPTTQAGGFIHGYICNYTTKEIAEYNPNTNPPFYTIRFPKDKFIEPLQHVRYTGPYTSHEYVPNFLRYTKWAERGFIVGCHGENISTYFDHPFKGRNIVGEEREEILRNFGVLESPLTDFKIGIRRRILKWLPHKIRRKLRYWVGEKIASRFYEFIRN